MFSTRRQLSIVPGKESNKKGIQIFPPQTPHHHRSTPRNQTQSKIQDNKISWIQPITARSSQQRYTKTTELH